MAGRGELEQCLERLRAAEHACREVDTQLSSLREKKAMLEQDRQRYMAEADRIRFCLQRRPLGQVGLSWCPDDVLLCIFEQLCISFEARWDTDSSCLNAYDYVRVTGPFRLASVCVRWRKVAIGFSRLWTYVAFPPPDGGAHHHMALVQLVLERSKSSPLDVLVLPQRTYDSDEPDSNRLMRECQRTLASFLNAVGHHAHHWGRLEVWDLGRDDLHRFTTPTPCLTHLKMHCDGGLGQNPLTNNFLPFAPLLCHLSVDADICCSDSHPGFPALVSLAVLGEDPSWKQVRQMLTLGGASLESATISVGTSPPEPLDTPSISLPRLRSLALTAAFMPTMGEPWSWNIALPNLTTLCLHGDLDYDDLAPFLQQLSSTVTNLTLSGGFISAEKLAAVRNLRNVSQLTLGNAPEDDMNYIVFDEFFVEIAHFSPPIWPYLTRIEIGLHGHMVSPYGSGLLQLVGSRSQFNSKLGPGVAILREVVVRDDKSSPALKAAIARLMAY